MRKAKNLIGLKVHDLTDGKDLGNVHDLLFSNDSRQLLGLLIHDRGLFGLGEATAIPYSQVKQIGTDAVMVPAPDAVVKVNSDPRLADAFAGGYTLTSKQLTTDQGETLGKISDLYLDDAGNVQGYEVSGGLFSDAYNGRRYLDAPRQITVGENVIIMPHMMVDDLNQQADEQPGGIKGAFSSAGESLTDTYDSAKESASGTYDNIAHASVEKQRDYVIGKVAGNDVIIPADRAQSATPAALSVGQAESGADVNAPSAGQLTSGLDIAPKSATATQSATAAKSATAARSAIATQSATATQSGGAEASGIDIVPVRANSEAIVPVDDATSSLAADAMGTDAGLSIVPSNQTAPAQETITNLQKATPATATDLSSSGEVVDGEVLVRKGETITAAHADRAIQAGVLAKLVAAAGVGSAEGSGAKGKAEGALSSAQQSTEELALGKPAAFEIDAPDGSVIVAPGQIVTREILARAEKHGKKAQVISSAGAGAVSEGAQTVYAEAKDVAADMWQAIREATGEFIGYTKKKKGEYDEASLEKKIKDAVGRPVTRVILAPDDHIILNTGDIITNKAVNEALSYDYVDMLLDSVYDTEPEITPEMMRAKADGDATLATQAHPTGGPITATVDKEDGDDS